MNRKAKQLLKALADLPGGATVVEIGCVRFPMEVPSDGYSTYYLAREAKRRDWDFHSVDIDPQAVGYAHKATKGLPVALHCADGVEWLRDFGRTIDALFLDGAAEPIQTVCQFEEAVLANEAIVLIDDVQTIEENGKPSLERGKGDELLDVLADNGWKVEIVETEPGFEMAVATR